MDRKHQFKRKSESASVMREKRRRERRGTSCHHRVLFQTLGAQQSGHAKDVYSARSGNDKKEPARQCVTLNGYLLGIMDFRSRDSLVCSTL